MKKFNLIINTQRKKVRIVMILLKKTQKIKPWKIKKITFIILENSPKYNI